MATVESRDARRIRPDRRRARRSRGGGATDTDAARRPDAADARRVQGGGSARPRRDRRSGRGPRAGERRRHRVGRRRGLGRSRSAGAGYRRHPLPRRVGEQDLRRARPRPALRRRQARPRCVGGIAGAGGGDRQPVGGRHAGDRPPPARAHGWLRRHALQRSLRPRWDPRPAARAGAPAESRVAAGALEAGHADVVLESRLRRRRAGRREGLGPVLRRLRRRADLPPARDDDEQLPARAVRRPGAGAGLCRTHRPAGDESAHLPASGGRAGDARRRSWRTWWKPCSAGANAVGPTAARATSSIRSTSRTWSGRGPRWRAPPGFGPAMGSASSARSRCRITSSATTAASTDSCRRMATRRRATSATWCSSIPRTVPPR